MITYGKENEITIFTCTEEVTGDQILNHLHLFYMKRITANVLWDFTTVQDLKISSETLVEIMKIIYRNREKRPEGKVALALSEKTQYVLSHLFQNFSEQQNIPVTFHSFMSKEKALEWLRE